MKTIYADFNDFAADGSLPLTCAGSVSSIEKLDFTIKDGDEFWLTDGELWVRAKVFLRSNKTYEARGDWQYHDHQPEGAG